MFAATEAARRRPSRKRLALIAGVAAIAIAAVVVVSILTGGKVTNGNAGPKSALVGKHVGTFKLDGLNGGVERAPWTEHQRAC